jgi:hypothetical protein
MWCSSMLFILSKSFPSNIYKVSKINQKPSCSCIVVYEECVGLDTEGLV